MYYSGPCKIMQDRKRTKGEFLLISLNCFFNLRVNKKKISTLKNRTVD